MTSASASEPIENERQSAKRSSKGPGLLARLLTIFDRRGRNDRRDAHPDDELQENAEDDLSRTSIAIVAAASVGFLGFAAYAFAASKTWWEGTQILGAGTLIAGSSFLVGSLLGFLFGIPRTLRQAGAASPDASATAASPNQIASAPMAGANGVRPANAMSSSYQVNTNLEEISDWLTKILVGVGLTELRDLPALFWNGCARFVGALGGVGGVGSAGVQAVAAALIVHFAATGFLFGYLLTRLFLAGAFVRAESVGTARLAQRALQASESAREEAGRTTERAANLQKGVDDLVSMTAQLLENQAISLLYLPKPEGFRKVLEAVEPFVQRDPKSTTPNLWVYLACAYGQAHEWARTQGESAEQIAALRDKAREAIQAAVEKSPATKPWLASLLRPQPGSPDDDLASLAGDPEIEALVN